MAEQYQGFITLELDKITTDINISMSPAGNYPNFLVYKILWDANASESNQIELFTYEPNQQEAVGITITNSTGHYETPEGALYQEVRIPKEASGYFTFYYNLQNPDEYIVAEDQEVSVQTFEPSGQVESLDSYIDVFSITFEVSDFYAEEELKYIKINDMSLSLKDNRSRIYYSPKFSSYILGPAVRAHVYGHRYLPESQGQGENL